MINEFNTIRHDELSFANVNWHVGIIGLSNQLIGKTKRGIIRCLDYNRAYILMDVVSWICRCFFKNDISIAGYSVAPYYIQSGSR